MTSPPRSSDTIGGGSTILALETSAGQCSVALLVGQACSHRSLPMTQGHSRVLLGLIDEVLVEAGVARSSIDAVGYGSGPGSFTGLRVACGVAQGLALGWDRPVVGVDTPVALALQASQSRALAQRTVADRIAVAMDLRMSEICHAVYDGDALTDPRAWPRPLEPLALGAAQAAALLFSGHDPACLWLAGDGFGVSDLLVAWAAPLVEQGRRPLDAVQPDARAVAQLARRGLALGRGVDAAQAAPFYLRDKVALDVNEQAALRASRGAKP
jgi:tRNA threonylcarbamoyladenosine biosynthesis protein TsaB